MKTARRSKIDAIDGRTVEFRPAQLTLGCVSSGKRR